jgi:hypothetical protein
MYAAVSFSTFGAQRSMIARGVRSLCSTEDAVVAATIGIGAAALPRMRRQRAALVGADTDLPAPEALLTGVDFARQIKQDQRLVFGTELFFDLREAEDYRVNSSMNYEITIDRETGMILRTGVELRCPGCLAPLVCRCQ